MDSGCIACSLELMQICWGYKELLTAKIPLPFTDNDYRYLRSGSTDWRRLHPL